ncbi:MAG: hypothetical protein NTNFB02_32200 [Nitrospira sp.]
MDGCGLAFLPALGCAGSLQPAGANILHSDTIDAGSRIHGGGNQSGVRRYQHRWCVPKDLDSAWAPPPPRLLKEMQEKVEPVQN